MDRAEHDERRRVVTREADYPARSLTCKTSPAIGARTVLRPISVSTVRTSASATATTALAPLEDYSGRAGAGWED